MVAGDLRPVRATVGRFGLAMQPVIHRPRAMLDRIELHAERDSGIDQPDFGGMVEVSSPPETLEAAGQGMYQLQDQPHAT